MTEQSIENVRDKLVSLGIDKVVIGDLPSRELNCVAIRPVDGYKSTYYFGMAALAEPLLEVIVRNTDYALGQNYYNLISKNLDKYSATQDGIAACILTGSPGYLGKDETGYNEWHMIFHLTLTSE